MSEENIQEVLLGIKDFHRSKIVSKFFLLDKRKRWIRKQEVDTFI